MHRTSRVTLILILAAALVAPAPAAVAAEQWAGGSDRPLVGRLLERFLGPILNLFSDGDGRSTAPPPTSAPADSEADGGPQHDPNG